MTHWLPLASVAVVVVLAISASPAAGQAETFDLQFKLTRGEALCYSDSGSVEVTIEGPQGRQTVQGQYEARQVIRALDVDPAGIMLMEFALENYRVTVDGDTEEPIEAPWTIRVRPDGRIVERIAGAQGVDDFPYALPGRPVRAGESWTRQARITQAGFSGQGTTTLTLAGVEGDAGARVARIRFASEGAIAPPEPSASQAVRVMGTIRVSGEFLWSLERGRTVRGSGTLAVEVESEGMVQGQTVRVRVSGRGTTRQETLAPSSVTVPAVPPDLLIAPGRGVGAFRLDQMVSDLTTRLGAPESLPADAGFRADGVFWPNGLVGFVDAADRNRLVGLDISDRRYRTERGIGFGSSEGAVLMAYGMSPVRVEMNIPNTGGARILIYSDLGIAFAITSDAAHATRGPGHAPIGAVDWISVFPPGGAGRIYPLP